MKVAVIGCGYWGQKYIRVLRELGHFVLRVDTLCLDGDMWNDHKRLTDRICDAAIVATPASTHASIVGDLLFAGIPTLVEKPMALRVADAEAMIFISAKTNTRLAVSNPFRFYDFGNLPNGLDRIDAKWLGGVGPREDCDVLWDMAPHAIDLCNLFFSGQCQAVTSATFSTDKVLVLTYPSGEAELKVNGNVLMQWDVTRTLQCSGEGWRTTFDLKHMKTHGDSEPLKLMVDEFLSGKLPSERRCRPEDGLEVVRILEMAHDKQK